MESNYRLALAVCGRYGLPGQFRADHASRIASVMQDGPDSSRHARAHREARRILAEVLHVPESEIPPEPQIAQAIGQYEDTRREYAHHEQPQFDYHDRWFAIENQVCPRCSRPGRFGDDMGRCACGFCY